MSDKKKTTLTGRTPSGPEMQSIDPVYPVYSDSGRTYHVRDHSVVLDYDFSQAETRWLKDLKKGEYYGPQVSGKSTLLVGDARFGAKSDPEILKRLGIERKNIGKEKGNE
jgi:hypothetical protein